MQTSYIRYETIALGLLKKEEEKKKEGQIPFFFARRRQCVCKLYLYSDLRHSFDWKSAVEHNGRF